MSISIRIRSNTIAPKLARLARKVDDRRPILEGMGLALVSVTKQAFVEPRFRPAPWRALSTGKAATLRRKGTLWRSIRIANLTQTSVTIASDRQYAAIHQLGGVIRPVKAKRLVFKIGGKKVFARKVTIPARPFFPFDTSGQMLATAKREVENAGYRALQAL